MRLSVKGLAIASALMWGVGVLGVGVCNLVWPNYGEAFLQLCASIYPGYHATRGIADVLTGFGYALVDGAVGGAVFAWLYNIFAGRG